MQSVSGYSLLNRTLHVYDASLDSSTIEHGYQNSTCWGGAPDYLIGNDWDYRIRYDISTRL